MTLAADPQHSQSAPELSLRECAHDLRARLRGHPDKSLASIEQIPDYIALLHRSESAAELATVAADLRGVAEYWPSHMPWQPALWGTLAGTLNKLVSGQVPGSKNRPAQSRALEDIGSVMGYMINRAKHCPLELRHMQPLLTTVQNGQLATHARHSMVQWALGYFLWANAMCTASTGPVPHDLQTTRRRPWLYRLQEAFYVVPRRASKYMHPIVVSIDNADTVLCASGCQFGSAGKVVDHWMENADEYRMTRALPAMFKTLAYVRGQQIFRPRRRAAVNRAIIAAGRAVIRTNSGTYDEIEHLVPLGLRGKITRRGRKACPASCQGPEPR